MINNETTNTPFFTIRREGVICLILVIAIIAVYWQVGNHEFVDFDDNEYVTKNRHVQAGLTSDSITWAFTSTHAANWHPLTWLSHMLDCQIYGLNPGGHHLTNVLLHILNTILLFLIFRRMTGALWKSAFVAALFALHPLHVESVAWVAERKDVLSTFFWMLTMGSYVWYVERRGMRRYLLVLLFFALGLMAKPMLVTLPFVLLLLDYWPLGRFHIRYVDDVQHIEDVSTKDTRRKKGKPRHGAENVVQADKNTTSNYRWSLVLPLLREKIPFLILAAVSSIVTFYVQQGGGAVGSLYAFPFIIRISNALASYISYIEKMLWPQHLALLYPHVLEGWKIAGAFLILIFISYVAVRVMKRFPYIIVGWFWYLGTLVPVIGLVQVGSQSMADRYTYVPLIGIFIIIAWGASDILTRWQYRRAFLAISAGCILSVLTIVTWMQLQYWQNSISLFEHTINVTTDNFTMHCCMGTALAEQGKIDEAVVHYTEALKIKPDYAEAHYGRGVVLQEQDKIDEAISHYTEALKIKPDYADVHYNLGIALVRQGRVDEAISHYSEAMRINPGDDDARSRLQMIQTILKETDKDIKRLKKLLEINPGDPELHYILGNQYYKRRDFDKSINQYQKALSIHPDAVPVLNNLAMVYMAKRDYEKAVSVFGRIADLQPDNASVYYNIACMYSIQNKTKESMDSLKMAIEKGYDNWEHIKADKDLKNIRSSLYYKELMSNQ